MLNNVGLMNLVDKAARVTTQSPAISVGQTMAQPQAWPRPVVGAGSGMPSDLCPTVLGVLVAGPCVL